LYMMERTLWHRQQQQLLILSFNIFCFSQFFVWFTSPCADVFPFCNNRPKEK
jgi:hypothetical protein